LISGFNHIIARQDCPFVTTGFFSPNNLACLGIGDAGGCGFDRYTPAGNCLFDDAKTFYQGSDGQRD
jgi:hypothetical protein